MKEEKEDASEEKDPRLVEIDRKANKQAARFRAQNKRKFELNSIISTMTDRVELIIPLKSQIKKEERDSRELEMKIKKLEMQNSMQKKSC